MVGRGGDNGVGRDLHMQSTTALDFKDKYWEPMRFNSRHKAVCVLKANGYTNAEIGEHLGYSEARVSVILCDKRAVEFLISAEKNFSANMSDVGEKILLLAQSALDQTEDIMLNGDKDSTRLTAALGILDRAGFSKVNKTIALEARITGEAARALMGVEIEEIPDADYSLAKANI